MFRSIILFLVITSLSSLTSVAQTDNKQDEKKTEEVKEMEWHQVIVTYKEDDIVGYVRMGEVEITKDKLMASKTKLRAIATEEMKKTAVKEGAILVFIEEETFEKATVNSITLKGVLYKK